MVDLNLTEKETDLLAEILEYTLSDLRTERLRTDNRELHARFVEREKFAADLIKRLESLKITP